MATELFVHICDVQHGACGIIMAPNGKVAMIDCGHNSETGWRPSVFLRHGLRVTTLNYLFISNFDRDHLSDAAGFAEQGIHVETIVRNASPAAPTLRSIKQAAGPIGAGMESALKMHETYWGPYQPFDQAMGGITSTTYCNSFGLTYPRFLGTNNLSMATFITFGGIKFLFPGDLEKAGWKALMLNPAFVAESKHTEVLIASHHGRTNGFCDEVFEHMKPQVVVISDDGVQYETQETVPDYRCVVLRDVGVAVTCDGENGEVKRRRVLTTRSDGHIVFRVTSDGKFYITTYPSASKQKAA